MSQKSHAHRVYYGLLRDLTELESNYNYQIPLDSAIISNPVVVRSAEAAGPRARKSQNLAIPLTRSQTLGLLFTKDSTLYMTYSWNISERQILKSSISLIS